MVFIDGVVIGLLLAKIRGGKWLRLTEATLRGVWLIVLAFVIQFGSIFLFPKFLLVAVQLSYFLLLVFVFLNRTKSGFVLMALGIAFNLLVMMVNGGRMPVEVEAARSLDPELLPALLAGQYGKHIAMSSSTHLNILGDFIYLRFPYPHPTIISIGDVFFSVGMIIFIQAMTLKKNAIDKGSVNC